MSPENKRAVSKNQSRLSADNYTEIETVNVEYTEYKTGQECPALYSGRLWPVSPGNIVKPIKKRWEYLCLIELSGH